MRNKHYLQITWAKAFDEIYCHHASLFIPVAFGSLFPTDFVYVGINTRAKILMKKKRKDIDTRFANYLPATTVDGGLMVPLNASSIVEALSLNSWTTFRTGERKELKEYPLNMFYSIDSGEEIPLPFKKEETPYLLIEKEFQNLPNGATLESKIEFDI